MIKLTTFKMWLLRDYSMPFLGSPEHELQPGCYEVERVTNQHNGSVWLVLKGTTLGGFESSWQGLQEWYKDCDDDENKVIIEETDDIEIEKSVQKSPETHFATTGKFIVTFKH